MRNTARNRKRRYGPKHNGKRRSEDRCKLIYLSHFSPTRRPRDGVLVRPYGQLRSERQESVRAGTIFRLLQLIGLLPKQPISAPLAPVATILHHRATGTPPPQDGLERPASYDILCSDPESAVPIRGHRALVRFSRPFPSALPAIPIRAKDGPFATGCGNILKGGIGPSANSVFCRRSNRHDGVDENEAADCRP